MYQKSHTHNSVVIDKILGTSRAIFGVLLIKTYFLVNRVSDYNVYEYRDPSRQLLNVTLSRHNSLAAAATKKQDGKNVLPIICA